MFLGMVWGCFGHVLGMCFGSFWGYSLTLITIAGIIGIIMYIIIIYIIIILFLKGGSLTLIGAAGIIGNGECFKIVTLM